MQNQHYKMYLSAASVLRFKGAHVNSWVLIVHLICVHGCSCVFFFWLPPSYWISKNTVGVLAYFSAIWLQKLCLSDQLQVPEWLFIHGLVVFGMKFGDCKTPNFWQNPSLKGTFWNKFECCATWLFFGGGSRGGQPCVWTNVWRGLVVFTRPQLS